MDALPSWAALATYSNSTRGSRYWPAGAGYDTGMTWEMLIIAAVRVLGSLPVLRWPLAGAIIAMLVDLSDLFMMNLIHLGGVKDYQAFDKYLDQVYMLTFLAVALRWQPLPRNIAVALYLHRLVGFVVFEVTDSRDLLLAFPNVFEFWFVFVAGLKFFRREEGVRREEGGWKGEEGHAGPLPRLGWLIPFRYSAGQLALVGAVLLGAKEFQEYALHYGRWFDNFTAVEAVEAVWHFVTAPLR